MTTITRERLEWLSNISGRDDIEDIGGDEIRELARIALASLEKEDSSEPVAFINGAWTLVYYRPPKELGLKIGDKLFTAPPAPVVPEELLSAMEEVLRISERDHEAWHKARNGIASCRAALLQGSQPVSNRDELPGGWVACSERMPEEDTYNVVADIGSEGNIYCAAAAWFIHGNFSPMDGISASNYDGGASIEIDMHISHWMPLKPLQIK